ncbi:MAG: (d)CMP kinase [Elusimicrobia bacterium]|nr:(d)CMP kinase [Elusimicrobiota bacterium]
MNFDDLARPCIRAERKKRLLIAMDGPAGVGKSTVGRLVAKALGYRFINTGEMYRALTWRALEERLDLGDAPALSRLARRIRWDFRTMADGVTIRAFVDGRSVARRIQDERVGKNSSTVASVPGVRRCLRRLQRRLGRDGGVVMEGRDIATNVFPDADLKIYLDASAAERARRRTRQLRAQGKGADFDSIRAAILSRDRQDKGRKANPLRRAKGAVVIDSTRLSLREVVDRILKRIAGRPL